MCRQCPYIYFRMTVMHKLNAGKDNLLHPSLWDTLYSSYIILCIIFIVSQSIFEFSLVIMTSLKQTKWLYLIIKTKLKSFTEKAGHQRYHQRYETKPWLYCEIWLEVSHVFLLFSQQKYLIICQHRSYHFLNFHDKLQIRTFKVLNVIWERNFQIRYLWVPFSTSIYPSPLLLFKKSFPWYAQVF